MLPCDMAKVIVIPARLASDRFPDKLLQAQTGWPLIRHVYDRCTQVGGVHRVVVAVDGPRLAQAVGEFGGEVILTDAQLPTGTDRVAAAVASLHLDGPSDLVVNVQGDEPELEPAHVERLFELLQEADSPVAVATLATRRSDGEGFANPNRVKVVVDELHNALYFSRAPIPSAGSDTSWLYHVGVYGFRPGALERFAARKPGFLERRERLEQLRFLEMGLGIRVAIVAEAAPGIDTPEDYQRFVDRLGRKK
ncbi:MAG: 3-deoxy-manno-octulosonate cytidylyltransferase [Planctomycetota bacterium]